MAAEQLKAALELTPSLPAMDDGAPAGDPDVERLRSPLAARVAAAVPNIEEGLLERNAESRLLLLVATTKAIERSPKDNWRC